VARVVEKWGGSFKASYTPDWAGFIRQRKAAGEMVVHLTMYGVGLQHVVEELREAHRSRGLVLVVGSSKVPIEVYELADLNVAVTNQPHSEVAALAVALDWIHGGKELDRTYPGAKIVIVPSRHGKLGKQLDKASGEP
jgi:Uncharacterized protein conserved in archaea